MTKKITDKNSMENENENIVVSCIYVQITEANPQKNGKIPPFRIKSEVSQSAIFQTKRLLNKSSHNIMSRTKLND